MRTLTILARTGLALALVLLLAAVVYAGQDGDGQSRMNGDCDDGDAGTFVGATETCNGRDDDCDSSVDEGCVTECGTLGEDAKTVLVDPAGRHESPIGAARGRRNIAVASIVGTSGVEPGLVIRLLGGRGEPQGVAVLDPQASVASPPAVVMRGDGPALTWVRAGSPEACYHLQLDAELAALHEPALLSSPSVPCTKTALAWSGAFFGVIWVEAGADGDTLEVQTRAVGGDPLGSGIPLSISSSGITAAAVAWDGEAFAVVWAEAGGGGDQLLHARFSELGVPLGTPQTVLTAGGEVASVALIWTGSRLVAAWDETASSTTEIMLAEISRLGVLITGPEMVSEADGLDSETPALTWTGSRIIASWHEAEELPQTDQVRRVPPGLVPEGPPVVLDSDDPLGPAPVVWSGKHLLLPHRSGDDGTLSLHLLGCIDEDADIAGFSVSDCQDGNAAIRDGAAEACDGLDQDCNLFPDDGCGYERCPSPRTEDAIALDQLGTLPGNNGWMYSLAWAGDRFGFVWREERHSPQLSLYFQTFDRQGTPLSGEVEVTGPEWSAFFPELIWTGREFALVWEDRRDYPARDGTEVYFRRFSREGDPMGATIDVSEIGVPRPAGATWTAMPAIVWTGTHYLIAWADHRDELTHTDIYTRMLDPEGVPLGPPLHIVDEAAHTTKPHLAWNGEEAGMVYLRGNFLYFMPLQADGRPAGPFVNLDPYISDGPRIVWAGDRYAVGYRGCQGDYCPSVMFVDRDGNELTKTDLTDEEGQYPRLVWTGDEVGIEWLQSVLPAGWIRLGRVGLDGQIRGIEDVARPDSGTLENYVGTTWTGLEYAFVWGYWPDDGDFEEYLTYLTCCRDFDGDGVSLCTDCDDADPATAPGKPELCDFADNDCDGTTDEGAPSPGAVSGAGFAADHRTLSWDATPGADTYDLIRGDLATLAQTAGEFSQAVETCLAASHAGTSWDDPEEPAPGAGWFYLVRARGCGDQPGSYDSNGPSQSTSRDDSIAASPAACAD